MYAELNSVSMMYYSPSGDAFSSCFGPLSKLSWPLCFWIWCVSALSSGLEQVRDQVAATKHARDAVSSQVAPSADGSYSIADLLVVCRTAFDCTLSDGQWHYIDSQCVLVLLERQRQQLGMSMGAQSLSLILTHRTQARCLLAWTS
jgi:hypothetical protein